MIRKLLILTSLAGFMLAVSTQAHPPYQNTQDDQQAPKVHSVTGKVTQVETGGKAFSMDVNLGSDKRPMRFVVDKTTTVQGHVAAGTTASVDYQPDSNGQLVALTVKEETAQSQ
jgi:multidrug efflux pump subunit AcrA (membrane-fusion protein)